MRNNIIAIMYDFDKTLCTRDMQEYTFIPNLGVDAGKFWGEANKLREENAEYKAKLDAGSKSTNIKKSFRISDYLIRQMEKA